jgi:uncharacterized protein DUF5927/core-2/I-Branching enzyme
MIGIVLLAHEQMKRTAQLAMHLTKAGCKVVVHIDGRVPGSELARLQGMMGSSPNLAFAPRVQCEWGTFGLIEASLGALQLMMSRWPEVTHVCQLSGSCLPIKPISALTEHLANHQDIDFIECVDVEREPWVIDGLSSERFSLYHPFPWRKYRRIFDLNVKLQRRLKINRKPPDGLRPHIGSQWWCLSRQTITSILEDPQLPDYKKYFRHTWIPDESFFQTMAVKHSDRITGERLTFVRFDPLGKPYVFYDDHLDMLLNADGFFARKIWRGAHQLYKVLLGPDLAELVPKKPDSSRMVARIERAQKRHQEGRVGLISQGRHPGRWHNGHFETARSYVVMDGLQRAMPGLLDHLNTLPGVLAHGYIFNPERVEFAGGAKVMTGNLSNSVAARDHQPAHFLSKLIWSERRKLQVILHDLKTHAEPSRLFMADGNAFLIRLRDRWHFDLYDIWRKDPASLATSIAPMIASDSDTEAALGASNIQSRHLSLPLIDILQAGPALGEMLEQHLPADLRAIAKVPPVRLPDDFPAFLAALINTGSAPVSVEILAEYLAQSDHSGDKMLREA